MNQFSGPESDLYREVFDLAESIASRRYHIHFWFSPEAYKTFTTFVREWDFREVEHYPCQFIPSGIYVPEKRMTVPEGLVDDSLALAFLSEVKKKLERQESNLGNSSISLRKPSAIKEIIRRYPQFFDGDA